MVADVYKANIERRLGKPFPYVHTSFIFPAYFSLHILTGMQLSNGKYFSDNISLEYFPGLSLPPPLPYSLKAVQLNVKNKTGQE